MNDYDKKVTFLQKQSKKRISFIFWRRCRHRKYDSICMTLLYKNWFSTRLSTFIYNIFSLCISSKPQTNQFFSVASEKVSLFPPKIIHETFLRIIFLISFSSFLSFLFSFWCIFLLLCKKKQSFRLRISLVKMFHLWERITC